MLTMAVFHITLSRINHWPNILNGTKSEANGKLTLSFAIAICVQVIHCARTDGRKDTPEQWGLTSFENGAVRLSEVVTNDCRARMPHPVLVLGSGLLRRVASFRDGVSRRERDRSGGKLIHCGRRETPAQNGMSRGIRALQIPAHHQSHPVHPQIDIEQI